MQTYFKLKIFSEYIAPLGILGIIVLFWAFIFVRAYIAEKWRKWRKQKKDRKNKG